jgi:hypothetical protein
MADVTAIVFLVVSACAAASATVAKNVLEG